MLPANRGCGVSIFEIKWPRSTS